jgi:hypothetical protein
LGESPETLPKGAHPMATIRFSKNIGLLLTGVWLLLWGEFSIFSITFANYNVIMGILALLAGVLVVIEYKD